MYKYLRHLVSDLTETVMGVESDRKTRKASKNNVLKFCLSEGGGGVDADVHIDPREEMLSATVLKILLKASSFLFRH